MTLDEFEKEFDIIYENINKGGAPGLVPYEKSVILTQAQELLVKQLVASETTLITNLIRVTDIVVSATSSEQFDKRSLIYEMPVNILHVYNEKLIATEKEYTIIAIDRASYDVLNSKAYRYPPIRRAWRILDSDGTIGFVEIIPRAELMDIVPAPTYRVRAVVQPSPIILIGVTESIRGVTSDPIVGNETDLQEALHPDILTTAAKLAEQHYMDKYESNG